MSETDTLGRRQSAPIPPTPPPAPVPPVSRSASAPDLAYAPRTLDWVQNLTGVRPVPSATVAPPVAPPVAQTGATPATAPPPPPTHTAAPPAPIVRPPARIVPPPPPRPAQLQQIINEQLMTFTDLSDKIGHTPHTDRLGGAWKMSKRYKVVEGAFGNADAELAAAQATPLAGLDQAGWTTLEQDVGGRLDDLVTAARSYRAKYVNKATKRGAADDLITDATRYKRTLSAQLKAVRTDPGLAGVQPHLTVDQALTAKRLGINFADCRFDLYNDAALDPVKSQAGFGAGKMNSVSKLVHADGTARIFKPEAFTDPGGAKATGTIGVDPDKPHFGNRNIATRAVADLLDASVIPQARFALHNGQIGLLMDKAPGESPGQNVKVANFNPATDRWFQTTLAQVDAGREDPNALARAGYRKGADGTTWERREKKLVKPWTNPPSPAAQASLHGQLNQLEWCDVLSGQMDRQPENYMVEINGDQATVTGIDNDLCFGKNQAKAEYSMAEGSTSVGKPQLIDAATLAKMKAMDFDRDLAPRLAGLLSTEEIDASRQRFAAVHQHALQLEAQNLVVDDWNTWRAPDGSTASAFLAGKKGGSIFSRDLSKFFKSDGIL